MKIKNIKDDSTILSVFEDLPFSPKRIYYMQSMGVGEKRGFHKHKKNKQILICIKGNFNILVNELKLTLCQHNFILLEPKDWHEMTNFSPDCVILVLASEEYDKDDYIREEGSRA